MKNILLTLGLLSVLGLNAAAQDDPAPGDRIEITFASGATIGGIVVKPAKPTAEPSLTLDLTWEYPGLNGTLTVPRKDIRAIRPLNALDEETIRKARELKQRQAADAPAKPAPAKPAVAPPEPSPVKPAADDAAKKAEEELRKAKEFYAKFPSPDWSPERRNAIRVKRYRGVIPTALEQEFEQGFDLWEKGRAASK